MKKILYPLIMCLSLMLYSCDSFLEENPKSDRDANSSFMSAADAYAVVNPLYRFGFTNEFHNAGTAYMAPSIFNGGYRTGLFDNEYSGQSIFNTNCYNLTINATTNNGTLSNLWYQSYRAITRMANLAISGIPTCPGLTDIERSKLIAEAKFFRALNMFFLVKNFGAVPISEEAITGLSNNLYPKRSTEKAVYNFIIADLKDALDNGNLPNKPMPQNGFRVSKGSVLALLADVYLNMAGYPLLDKSAYAEAAKYSNEIIESGAYSLIKSDDKGRNSVYNILRTSDNESEYLYSVEYEASISSSNWYPVFAFPVGWAAKNPGAIKYNITCSTFNPNENLVKIYNEENDLRVQEGQYFHTSYKGIPLGGRHPHFFVEEEALENTALAGKDRNVYRTAEMYLIYAEAAAQANATVPALAIERLAEIQARASLKLTKQEIITKLKGLSKDEFIKEVWREKIRELMFECKLWNDITRTRQYPDLRNAKVDMPFIPLIGAVNPYNATFKESDLVYPYPYSELQRNPNMAADPIE